MLAIVLTVLKIIGIILLCLLVTVLVLAGLVLFVPVRYHASGYYRGAYAVHGKLSWLLHLITVKVSFCKDDELQLIVRLLGIPIYDMQRKKQKVKKAESRKKERLKAEQAKEEVAGKVVTKPPVPHRPGNEENTSNLAESVKEMESGSQTNGKQLMDEIVEKETPQEEDGFAFFEKLKLLFTKCKERIMNIKYTFRRICDKIKHIKDNITYYVELWQEENTKLALAACKKELLRIWKDIKPKKFRVNALLGTDDPGTTGQIIGYCAMLYPVHQGNIVVVPDFENKVVEADFLLKGKITVYVYIVVAYTMLFNKNIKRLKKCLLREDS